MGLAREKIASGDFVAWKNQVVTKLGQRR